MANDYKGGKSSGGNYAPAKKKQPQYGGGGENPYTGGAETQAPGGGGNGGKGGGGGRPNRGDGSAPGQVPGSGTPGVPSSLDMSIYRPTDEWTPDGRGSSMYEGDLGSAPGGGAGPGLNLNDEGWRQAFFGDRQFFRSQFRNGPGMGLFNRLQNMDPNEGVRMYLRDIIAEDPTNPTIPGGGGLKRYFERNPAAATWLLNYMKLVGSRQGQ